MKVSMAIRENRRRAKLLRKPIFTKRRVKMAAKAEGNITQIKIPF
jgi:hypothetical protein